jgi:hypothetical protein
VLLNEALEPYGVEALLGCRTTLGNASLAVEYAEDLKFGGSSTALYIGLGVIGAALLFFAALALLVWALSRGDKETREALARNVSD